MAAIEVDNFKRAQARLRETFDENAMDIDFNNKSEETQQIEDEKSEKEQQQNSNDSKSLPTSDDSYVLDSRCSKHSDDYLMEDQREGTVVCTACGLVIIDQLVCESGEWRTFADDNQNEKWQRSRVGGVAQRFLTSESNLNTTIRSESRTGGNLYNSTIVRMSRRKHFDNGMIHAMKQLDEMAERINLTKSVLEYAQYIYYKMYRMCNYKGIVLFTDAKIGASLYIACLKLQCPRTISEICAITECDHDEIRRAVQRITRVLKLSIERIMARDLIPRYCSWLSLTRDISKQASQLADAMTAKDVQHTFLAETIAASAIYFTTVSCKMEQYKCTLHQIADTLVITIDSIRDCCKYFLKHFNELYSS